MYQSILVETRDRTGLIRLNRPKQYNALNDQLMDELGRALSDFDNDDAIHVIVLTGSDKAFAAGADIESMKTYTFMDVYRSGYISRNWEALRQIRKPVIAAVNGYALGGGCEFALACDFIIAADNAKFGQPEVKWGINPCFGGTQRLSRALAPGMAKELLYTARFIDADEAFRIGLVNRVLPQDRLLEAALATAKEIQGNGKTAVQLTKQSVNSGRDVSIDTAIYHEAQFFGLCFDDPEQKKRMTAFAEKSKK